MIKLEEGKKYYTRGDYVNPPVIMKVLKVWTKTADVALGDNKYPYGGWQVSSGKNKHTSDSMYRVKSLDLVREYVEKDRQLTALDKLEKAYEYICDNAHTLLHGKLTLEPIILISEQQAVRASNDFASKYTMVPRANPTMDASYMGVPLIPYDGEITVAWRTV